MRVLEALVELEEKKSLLIFKKSFDFFLKLGSHLPYCSGYR
jgi:hypothetical protein